MIINSIEMTYFFRFYKSPQIDFSISEDKNVVVIKGDNGTGKTTMLSAFSWVFYGVVEDPLVVGKMLNKRRLSEMSIGEIENSGVKVSITESNRTYLMSRIQRFKKTAENECVIVGEPELTIFDISNPAEHIKDKDFFERIIPSDLKGFFFFDGERIDRLAKIDGREEIRKAILDILGLTTLERIEAAVESVQSDYNKKIKKVAKNEILRQLRQEYEDTEAIIQSDKEKLEGDGTKENPGLIAIRKKAEAEVERCTKFLKEHNAEAVKNLQLQRDNLETEKNNIQSNIDRETNDIMRHVSKNFKYYLLSDRFKEISDFLEEKRIKKELPSDLKFQFVSDLLESGECICGQKLVEGQIYFTNIKKLLLSAGREELDNAYITMRAFVDSNEINDLAKDFYDRINVYDNKMFEFSGREENIDKELKEIGKKLANDFGDLIANYEAQLEKAQNTKETCLQEEYYYSQNIKSNETKKRALEQKIKIEEKKQGDKDMFSDAFNMAIELGNLNEEIRTLFIDITREDMDSKIKDVFANISRKDDREACLNEKFELTIRNKVSHQPQILSTGERQITSLSFIGALVSYAKEKANSDLITDFSGGDFPIVMDSAFGNLDPTHKANVAKGLPQLATQVIVIISDAQWKGTVEENIAERVNNVYNMCDGQYDGNDDEYTEFEEGIK